MTYWIQRIALVLMLGLLLILPRTDIAAMGNYPRTSSAMCDGLGRDSGLSGLDVFGCQKGAPESERTKQCLPVFDEERQTRAQVCSFLK